MAKTKQTFMDLFMGLAPGLNAMGQLVGPAVVPNVVAKTAAYTVKSSESGTIFTTIGATAAVTFTLPAIADGPFIFLFINGVDLAMTVAAETNDTLIGLNDVDLDSIAFSTTAAKIGAALLVICDGTSLFGIDLLGTATRAD